MNELYKKLKFFGSVKMNIPLAKFSTFKIGGPADFLVEVKETSKISELLNFLSQQGIDFFILGGGSNVLFPDDDLNKVVIKISTNNIKVKGNLIEADAGTPLSLLVSLATKNSLGGLEWAIGIPGTLGGAIRGNAGAMGQSIGNSIKEVFVWEDGDIRRYSQEECLFDYRDSIFKQRYNLVILQAILSFKKAKTEEIANKISEYLLKRSKLPKDPSAGSFFKNIKLQDWPGDIKKLPELFQIQGMVPAGWVIENCGLKGCCIGDACVSKQHGNFIVNMGKATQLQIIRLVEKIQEEVYNKYGVGLEPEVQIVVP